MRLGSTIYRLVLLALWMTVSMLVATAQTSDVKAADIALDPQDRPLATRDKAYQPQLSGTIVDTSGAIIAEASVQVRSANGTVLRTTRSDRNGSFILSGLSTGNYRLTASNPGFETKEIIVTIGAAGASTSLRISLMVGSVSITLNVQGREDDLIGVASSAIQGP